MRNKTRKDFDDIVDKAVVRYNAASDDDRGGELTNLIKVVNVAKDLDTQTIENRIKNKKIKLDLEKLDIERKQLILQEEKLTLDKEQMSRSSFNEVCKLNVEKDRLEFDREKLNFESTNAKVERKFGWLIKSLEIGLPLIGYLALSTLALKATYKDDVRIPSETWGFIKGVFRR